MKVNVSVPLVCLSLLAACSGGSGKTATSTSTATTSPTAAASQPPAKATLKPALLVVSDFPTGWTTKPAEADGSKPKFGGDCGTRFQAFDKKYPDATAKVESDFEKESSEIDEQIQAYASAADIAKQFNEYATIVRGCTTLKVSNAGKVISLKVGEISLPKFGEESFGFTATGELQGIEIILNEVIVRRGGLLVEFTQSDVLEADTDLLVSTVTKAMAKVNEVLPATG